MGRFHRHDDGTWHEHDLDDPEQADEHLPDAGDHSRYEAGRERVQLLERVFGENDRMADANRAFSHYRW